MVDSGMVDSFMAKYKYECQWRKQWSRRFGDDARMLSLTTVGMATLPVSPIMTDRSFTASVMDVTIIPLTQHYNFVIILSCRRQPRPIKIRRCPGESPFFCSDNPRV